MAATERMTVEEAFAALRDGTIPAYDRAMAFIRNAKNALQIKNYINAEQLAAKAASLARELVKN